jgi:hypothetical protein
MKAEQVVKELIRRRQMEAIKNQIGNKLTVIAQNFGQPVVSSGFRQTNPKYWEQEDGFYVENFQEIQTVEETDDWVEYEMGWYFNGLRFGVNLEVLVLLSEESEHGVHKIVEIKASYNGYVVFAEIEGKIKAYAPFKAWEERLNDIHDAASRADKRRKHREKIQQTEESKTKLNKVWKMVRMLWGG